MRNRDSNIFLIDDGIILGLLLGNLVGIDDGIILGTKDGPFDGKTH